MNTEQEFAHKQEIVETRVGCVGSSDAKMLMQIENLGEVPQSAYHRMAVVKGITPSIDNVHSSAVEYGNIIEAKIYEFLSHGDKRYLSNPLWVSSQYSRANVKCIAHPDIVFIDHYFRIINVYEVKTSRHSTNELKREYRAQIFLQNLIAKELALSMGKGWKVRMNLVHYDTTGLDLSQENEFDINRMTISRVLCQSGLFDLGRAMDIVDKFLETFTDNKAGEVIEAKYLPEEVMHKFSLVADMLREIDERQKKVEEFKERLFDFLTQKNIVKVQCDEFSFTRVAPSTTTSFNASKWFEDYAATIDEEEARSIREKYTQKKERKGYVLIKVSNNKSNH